VVAHDRESRAALPAWTGRSETCVEVALTAAPFVMFREVHQWIMAVHAFLTRGEYSEPIDWTELPSARTQEAG
jgi:hypothetical protein